MRKTLRRIFGDRCDNVMIIHENGQDWVLVRDLCNLIGLQNEYHAVEDHYSDQEFNLNEADKRKFYVPGGHRKCAVWFVSDSGFWKIIGRSHAPWAVSFRARLFTETMPEVHRQLD